MFNFKNKPAADAPTPRRDTRGIIGLRERSANEAQQSYNSDTIEDKLRRRQQSAERADAWATHISEPSG